MIVEVKWDGEHMLVHWNGVEFRVFSRRGNDFTPHFASLTRRLLPLFRRSLKSVVLDCEAMIYNKNRKCYGIESSLLRKSGLPVEEFLSSHFSVKKGKEAGDGSIYDVKHLKDDSELQASLIVYDILWLNGQDLRQFTLQKRRKLLEEAVLMREEIETITLSRPSAITSRFLPLITVSSR